MPDRRRTAYAHPGSALSTTTTTTQTRASLVGLDLATTEAIEQENQYRGTSATWDAFFLQFGEVIFRTYGSVLPNIIPELVLAFGVGWVAYFFASDANLSSNGHQLFGFLLGFLIVFRTQAGFNLYLEGLQHLGAVVSATHTLAAEVLACAAARVEDDKPLYHAEMLDDTLRHMKLLFYSVAEHVRSNDAMADWEGARKMVEKHASEEELAELREEFGPPTMTREKHTIPQDVGATFAEEFEHELHAGGTTGPAGTAELGGAGDEKRFWRALRQTTYDGSGTAELSAAELSAADFSALEACAASLGDQSFANRGVRAEPAPASAADGARFNRRTISVEGLAAAASSTIAAAKSTLGAGRTSLSTAKGPTQFAAAASRKVRRKAEASAHDPTNSKPLVVLLWLKHDLRALEACGAVQLSGSIELANAMTAIVDGYKGMCKIDKLVLPLPYCQLLKIFSLFFVFSVPFVLAPTVGLFTPWISLFLAAGYFGLDHVGAELECPYGVDDNDLPLLAIGLDLCKDIDALRRTAMRLIKRRRSAKRTMSPQRRTSRISNAMMPANGHVGGGDAGGATTGPTPVPAEDEAANGIGGATGGPVRLASRMLGGGRHIV